MAGVGPELVAWRHTAGAVIMSIVMAGLRIAYFGGGAAGSEKHSKFYSVAL